MNKPQNSVSRSGRKTPCAPTLAEWAETLARELDKTGRERTARAYRGAVKRFSRFMDGRPIELRLVSSAIIGAFQIALRLEGLAPNTISFYMRMLRSVLNKAVACGIATLSGERIFAGVYTGVAQTKKRALTTRELRQMASLDIAPRSEPTRREAALDDARDLFMFGYHARGMSFVDMAYLKKSDISGHTIRYARHKTGRQIELAVLPQMQRIIERFAPSTRGSEYVFPIITEAARARAQYESGLRRQNALLKELGRRVGVEHRVSTHDARHSWATMARNCGLPLAVISEGLGHSSQRTTEIYLATIERGVLERASRKISDAISNPSLYK